MRPRARLLPDQIALRAAALAVVGAAAAYLLVPDASRLPSVDAQAWTAADASSTRRSVVATPVVDDRATMSTKVQSLLAEGGCPGWIAVANHPEWLEPTTDDAEHGDAAPPANLVPPGAVRLASERRSDAVPRVKHPVPLRLAAGEDLLAEEDDLLDGADDLVPLPPVDDPPAPRPESPVDSPAALSEDADELLTPDERPAAATSNQQPSTPAPPKSAAESSDDDLLTDEDDLLTPPVAPTPPGPPTGSAFAHPPANVPNPHAGSKPAAPQTPLERCEFVAQSRYPAATECRACHEQIYDEWAMSSHAYAFVSPMFHKFEQKINDVAQGTIGYFCYRCHSPAGTELGISRAAPLWELPQVAREGVTCVACHRVNEFYGRTNGERRIVPGDVYDPVYGTIGGHGVAEAISRKDDLKLKTSPDEKGPGQPIHTAGFYNPQLATSDFCITCHQVAVFPGIKLEVVWEQYRASPACQKGIRCQDCHMGRIPGVPSGFEVGPAAVVNKKNVGENRKHSNHVFYGPGYSIAHPGIFPFNPKAYRWTMREWLLFDWRAGWGTEEFEDAVDAGRIHVVFPAEWKESDDRCDAREIIEDNLKRRAKKDQLRLAVMENGSHVDGPFFKRQPVRGQPLEFEFIVANTNEGHNLPTASLGAQPQLWANVVLIGPRGNRLWETGYLDSLGDLADIHSVDVRRKRLAFDAQLFNLQTMFLITGAKGTDREFFLPVNVDIDQLPFIRPGAQPISVINHPPFIRMEARSLPPLGSRRVPYKVPAELMGEPGHYRLSFRMRSRLEPLYFMRFCDATPEMQRAMTEGILDFHESSMEFFVP